MDARDVATTPALLDVLVLDVRGALLKSLVEILLGVVVLAVGDEVDRIPPRTLFATGNVVTGAVSVRVQRVDDDRKAERDEGALDEQSEPEAGLEYLVDDTRQ